MSRTDSRPIFVKAPKGATVRATTTNGEIDVAALGGKLIAQTTNGDLRAKNLTGGVDARTTNGDVRIDVASLGTDRVELTTTNGSVTLTLPETAKEISRRLVPTAASTSRPSRSTRRASRRVAASKGGFTAAGRPSSCGRPTGASGSGRVPHRS